MKEESGSLRAAVASVFLLTNSNVAARRGLFAPCCVFSHNPSTVRFVWDVLPCMRAQYNTHTAVQRVFIISDT